MKQLKKRLEYIVDVLMNFFLSPEKDVRFFIFKILLFLLSILHNRNPYIYFIG